MESYADHVSNSSADDYGVREPNKAGVAYVEVNGNLQYAELLITELRELQEIRKKLVNTKLEVETNLEAAKCLMEHIAENIEDEKLKAENNETEIKVLKKGLKTLRVRRKNMQTQLDSIVSTTTAVWWFWSKTDDAVNQVKRKAIRNDIGVLDVDIAELEEEMKKKVAPVQYCPKEDKAALMQAKIRYNTHYRDLKTIEPELELNQERINAIISEDMLQDIPMVKMEKLRQNYVKPTQDDEKSYDACASSYSDTDSVLSGLS